MNSKIRNKLDVLGLPVSILLGIIGYPIFRHLHPFLAPTVFLLLFFTFLKVEPRKIRLQKWHFVALISQMLLTFLAYYLTYNLLLLFVEQSTAHLIAMGAMFCFMVPTASSAPVITAKLGGQIESLTTYTILCNFVTSMVIPIFLPIIHPALQVETGNLSLTLLWHVAPLLLGPLFFAWFLRLLAHLFHAQPTYDKLVKKTADFSFYIWMINLVILMADVSYSMATYRYNLWLVALLVVLSFLASRTQFFVGRQIGLKFPEKDPQAKTYIATSHALGQKNTSFGIWIVFSFLEPSATIVAIGVAVYIICQNLHNAKQIKDNIKNANQPA